MVAICSVPDCGRPMLAKGLCSAHYQRQRTTGRLGDQPIRGYAERSICVVEGCSDVAQGNGYCRMHYQRWRRHGDPLKGRSPNGRTCSVDGCGHGATNRGMCASHAYGRDNYGDPRAPRRRRTQGQGTYVDGYRVIVVDGLRVMEHRHVIASVLRRDLLPQETVHHVNGIRDDNRLENLELWTSFHPCGQRVADKVEWATTLLALYAPERLINEYRRDQVPGT